MLLQTIQVHFDSYDLVFYQQDAAGISQPQFIYQGHVDANHLQMIAI